MMQKYAPSNYVVPSTHTDEAGMLVVSPRQRYKAGMLVYVMHSRTSSNQYTNYPYTRRFLATVLGEHDQDTSLLNVVAIGSRSTYDTQDIRGRICTVTKRTATIVNPDPAFYLQDNVALPSKLAATMHVTSLGVFITETYVQANKHMMQVLRAKLSDGLKDTRPVTRYESLVARAKGNAGASWPFTATDSSTPILKRWIKARKERGEAIAKALNRVKADPSSNNVSQFKLLIKGYMDNGNLHSDSKAKLEAVLTKTLNVLGLTYFGTCDHWGTVEGSILVGYTRQWVTDNYPSAPHRFSLCPTCGMNHIIRGRIMEAIDATGAAVLLDSDYSSWYRWSDDTIRTYAEPPVIGGYHTSKESLLKPLPHADGTKAHPTPFVGYELEFVVRRDDSGNAAQSAETTAKQMLGVINTAVAGANLGTQKYGCFERDGSVDFEFVSGYGPMDIHREALVALLNDGKFAPYVMSHDGGRCGLHVHLDKPASLLHAIKLTRFYHATQNRSLLLSVARRYSGGYSKVIPNKMEAKADVRQAYRNGKERYTTPSRKQRIARAMLKINSDRYEVCNWQNLKTVEIRVFRGSLRLQTVLACLEFAYMSWHFAKDTTADSLDTSSFLAYVSKPEWRHETRYLREYLDSKGFVVWTPRAKPVKDKVEVMADLCCEA